MRRSCLLFLIAATAARAGEIEDLVRGLGDDDPAVREASTDALIERGDAAGAALREALESRDDEVRARAARILRVQRWVEAVPASFRNVHPEAAREMAEGSEDDRVRWVKRLVRRLGPESSGDAVPVLLLGLDGVGVATRRFLLLELSNRTAALPRYRFPELLPPLVAAIGDEDASIRGLAIFCAGAWGVPGEEDGFARAVREGLVPAVRRHLRDEDIVVRAAAVRALGEMRDRESREEFLDALQDPAGTVRAAAARALEGCGDRRDAEALVRALADPGADVVRSAAAALGALGVAEAAEALAGALERADLPEAARICVIEALVRVDPRGAEAVRPFVADAVAGVRAVAWRVALAADLRDAATALRDEHAVVRLVGVAALARGDASHLPLLVALLDDTAAERLDRGESPQTRSWEVRELAMRSLEAISGETMAGEDLDARAAAWKAWWGRRAR